MKRITSLKHASARGGVPVSATDAEIAATAIETIQWLTTISSETLNIEVQNGWIHLGGTVQWSHQRDTLVDLLRRVPGVKGIRNQLVVKPDAVAQTAA